MSTRHYDAAILDLDGTLVDTLPDFALAIGRMLDELGLPAVELGFVERTIGKGGEHLIRHTLAQAGGAPERFGAAWASYQAHYGAVNGTRSALYPGVVEGLDRLAAAGVALACVTNKPFAFADALLERKGLRARFDCVFGGDSLARKKPDPLPLLETCQRLGSTTARTLMIGDSSNDAAAARAAGCPVVLVRYGYNHGEPIERVDADAYVDRLDEIQLLS